MKKIVSLIIVIFSFLYPGFSQDKHLIDSLEIQLKNHNAHNLEFGKNAPALYDTTKANILYKLSNAWVYINDDKALDYANQLLVLSEKMEYKRGISNAYSGLGLIMLDRSNYAAALELNRKSLKIREEIGDKNGIAGSFNNIGSIFLLQDNYPEALKYYFNALRINEQTGNKELQAFNLCNISEIYVKQGDYSEALAKLLAAGKFVDKSGVMFLFPVYYIAIGSIYEKQGNIEEALDNYFKYMEGCQKFNYSGGKAIASNRIGNIYQKQGDFDKALKLFFSALEIFKKKGNDLDIAETYLNIGNTYSKQNNYGDGAEYLNKALYLSQKINGLEFIKQSYESLSGLEKSRGNFALALNYYKLSITYRDSILNSENTKKSLGLQLQYETEKKDKQIALLTKESQLQQTELQKQKSTRNVWIAAFALIALLTGVSFNRNYVKKKANAEIEKTFSYLKNTQEQLIEFEKLASLGKLTADVAREIEVPVTQIGQLNKTNRMLIHAIKNNKRISEGNELKELKSNLHRIYNYGKDADRIVKNVLRETRKL